MASKFQEVGTYGNPVKTFGMYNNYNERKNQIPYLSVLYCINARPDYSVI